MSDVVRLERVYQHPQSRVFEFFSKEDRILSWFGPEGLQAEGKADFERPGAYHIRMVNKEGQTYKVSGEVTSVKPPSSLGFTWAWHDDEDKRGHESFVLVEFEALTASSTRLVLSHSKLPDDEARANHSQGWTSSFNSLEAALAA